MSQTYLAMFSIITLIVCNVIQSASSDTAAAAAAAASGYQDNKPTPTATIVDNLATSIAEGLLWSTVLGEFAKFQVDNAHDLFFRVGNRLLGAADIYDPDLSEVPAQAAAKVGMMNSHLYFYTIGYTLAKFLKTTQILSYDNVDYLALRIVGSIELVACTDGVFDTETMMNAVVYGFFKVLASYGVTNYDNMETLFYLCAGELKRLRGKY